MPKATLNLEEIRADFTFLDHRGFMYSHHVYPGWIQENVSISRRGVLRGIHVSPNVAKTISCLWGEIYAVVVDCRPESPTFCSWEPFFLNRGDTRVLVPKQFGLAHLVLSDQAIFQYLWNKEFDGDEQLAYRWDDPAFGIEWPTDRVTKIILSKRDAAAVFMDGNRR